jgi:hypothetical protein
MPTFDPMACAKAVAAKDVPVRHVLACPPQPLRALLAVESADVAVVGPDFAPNGFTNGVVRRGAALVSREGDFGFSAPNGNPKEGHDVQLVHVSPAGEPLDLELSRFAFNCRAGDQRHLPDGTADCASPADQAFVEHIHGINRPVTLMFGPDGAAYLGRLWRGAGLWPEQRRRQFNVAADAPLVQISHTGTIWRITRAGAPPDLRRTTSAESASPRNRQAQRPRPSIGAGPLRSRAGSPRRHRRCSSGSGSLDERPFKQCERFASAIHGGYAGRDVRIGSCLWARTASAEGGPASLTRVVTHSGEIPAAEDKDRQSRDAAATRRGGTPVRGNGRQFRLTTGQLTTNPAAPNGEPSGAVIMPWLTRPLMIARSPWRVFAPSAIAAGAHAAMCTSQSGL